MLVIPPLALCVLALTFGIPALPLNILTLAFHILASMFRIYTPMFFIVPAPTIFIHASAVLFPAAVLVAATLGFAPVMFVPRLIVVPVPVVAHGHAHQGRRHGAGLDPGEPGAGIASPVPAIRPSAPVPSPTEEDLLGNPLDDLNARLNHHETRRNRQLDIDADAHLRVGDGRANRQGSYQ